MLKTFKMIIANFQIKDKIYRPRFFSKTFLITNINFKIILKMLFLKFNNANISFNKKILM